MYNWKFPSLDDLLYGSYDLAASALLLCSKKGRELSERGGHPRTKGRGKVFRLFKKGRLGIKSLQSSLNSASLNKMEAWWHNFKLRKRPRKLITRSISDYVISSVACFAFGEMVRELKKCTLCNRIRFLSDFVLSVWTKITHTIWGWKFSHY